MPNLNTQTQILERIERDRQEQHYRRKPKTVDWVLGGILLTMWGIFALVTFF